MLTMYNLTVPALTRGLGVLSGYMEKAEHHASSHGLDASELVEARLFADMLPLSGQVQRVSDNAKAGAGRLTGIKPPSFEDTEKTFAELKDRIAKTIAFLETLTPGQFEEAEKRPIELRFRNFSTTMSGFDYATKFLLPNAYFHIATAHGILRNKGVAIGKLDYVGSFDEASR